jgi:hypothetical protein
MACWSSEAARQRGPAASCGRKAGFTLGSAMSSARSFSVRVMAAECHSQKPFATFCSTWGFFGCKHKAVSENISSSVLFHFTKSLDDIVDILTSGFYPHYCPEYLFNSLDAEAASSGAPPLHAAPMICFCDLPLSLIRKHLAEYGNFGIGLSKKWGIENGVTPVLYVHEQSQMFKAFSNRLLASIYESDKAAHNDWGLLAAYFKHFRGSAWREGKTQSDIHFYDEREWRSVPRLAAAEEFFVTRNDYTDKKKIATLHASLKQKYKLIVSPNDIQYLIVPDDRHILQLVEHLRKLYNLNDATLVTTAIMTTDCIHEDV